MIETILKVFDLLRGVLRLAGVDYPKFRAILGVKLQLDTMRKNPTLSLKQGNKPRNEFLLTLTIYTLFGFFAALMIFAAASPLVAFTFVNSYILTMVAMALVADFSSVLLDTADHQILGPRPVSPRTVLMARLAHIAVYLSLLTFSMAFFSFLVGTWKFGWLFPPVFAISLAAGVVLVLAIVCVFYLAVMRFFKEEKVRDIILYAQIGMAVGVVGGYQILPRLIDFSKLRDLDISQQPWIYVYPPTWFAAPIDLLAGTVDRPRILLTLLALAAPLASMALVSVLAPRFRIAPEAGRRSEDGSGSTSSGRVTLVRRLSRLVTRGAEERAGFELTWQLAAQNRRFKLRIYPNLAFILIFGFIFMFFVTTASPAETWSNLPNTQKHLLLFYLGLVMTPALLTEVRFTDRPEGAWVYKSLPLQRPGELLLGGVKALCVRFALPLLSLVTVFVLAIWGVRVLLDVLLASSLSWCVLLIFALIQEKAFPFSSSPTVHQSSGVQAKNLAMAMISALAGLGHWGLTFTSAGVALAIPITLVLGRWLSRVYSTTGWSEILVDGA